MNLKNFVDIITHWEKWHYHYKYIPLYPAWLWYCFRAGSIWFFTPSNPTLTFGGFEGESKKEMYDQLPPGNYPQSIYISPSLPFKEVKKLFAKNFTFPVAVKPDEGMMGLMFRKIENAEHLKRYHDKMPVKYIIQELVNLSMEVSVFYYRFPDQQKGTITGFITKEFLDVTGNGTSTLKELIENFPERPGFFPGEWTAKHKNKLHEILPAGEVFRLSWAANLSRGSRLISLKHEIDEKLLNVFDDLSHYTKCFYYGRYDIKCNSVDELKAGKFSILEFNGCGAEPHHIYGTGNNLLQAYKIILQHWNVLYKISKYNNHQGIKYWKFKDGFQFLKNAKKHFKMLKKLDTEFI